MRIANRLAVIVTVATLGIFVSANLAGADVRPRGKARGATIVTLDQGTIQTVVSLGLVPAAVEPGVLGMDGSDLQASFPIVGNLKDGVIRHTGGLSLSAGAATLSLTNYAIDANAGALTARATLNGQDLGRLPLFDLAAAPKQSGCAATAHLRLSSDAAGALTAIFAAPDLTGADFGVACVTPR